MILQRIYLIPLIYALEKPSSAAVISKTDESVSLSVVTT